MFVAALLFAVCTSCKITHAIHVFPCTDSIMDVFETRTNNNVTCSGFPGDNDIVWQIVSETASYIVSTCLVNTVGTCENKLTTFGYTASRSSDSLSSVMIINPLINPLFVVGGMIFCQANKGQSSMQSTGCTLNIVSPPERVSCAMHAVIHDTLQTATGTCNITKVYSSLNKYTCQWYVKVGSLEVQSRPPVTIEKTSDSGVTLSKGTYINGRCDLTMNLPIDATYTFKVVVTPGGEMHDAGILDIKKPSPSVNCPEYVLEDQNLTCTCAGDAGLPPAVLKWNTNTGSSTLTVINVKRSQNGSQHRCQAMLSGAVIQEVVYTVSVAYGPDSATITSPDPFDTDGSRDMTITCTPSESNPTPTFSWTRAGRIGVLHQRQTYTFRPQPPTDDSAVLQCRAQNTISNKNATDTVTVSLHYPPTSDPVISNNSSDGNLYEGDSVVFTCTATGGKPANATSTNLTCPSAPSATGVTSSVTLTSLSDAVHNRHCTCNTTWKGTNLYTKNTQSTLFVYTSPSPPVITVVNQDGFIAGRRQQAVLTCVSPKPGRPAASYDWPLNGGGQNDVNGHSWGTLTFPMLSKEDNGKNVTCRANNPYTVFKQLKLEGTFTLQVYYPPDITLSTQENNDCSGSTQCSFEVTEGKRIRIRCSAESNPAPDGFNWTSDRGNDTGSTVGSEILDIAASNHTVNNRQYRCTVTTGRFGNNGQTLTSSKVLTILVKYKPMKTQLTLNAQNKNLTINENETVVLACHADGRPTPYVEVTDGLVATSSRGGETVLEDRDTWHNTTLTAQCHHTGQYKCTANNSVGQGPTDTAMLFVNCKPRESHMLEIPTVKYVDTPQEVSFNLVAYPVPDSFTFSYLGPSPDNKSQTAGPVVSNTLQMNCFTTNNLYKVICNVTVDNITSESEVGLYGVRVSNSFGHVDLEFMITFNESIPAQPYKRPFVGAAIGGGIAAAVVVIIVAALIVLFLRRRRTGLEGYVQRPTKALKSDKIKLSTPDHSGASSTHDKAMETDEKSHKKPTAVVSPKTKTTSRTHHGKAGAVYENVELHTTFRDHNDEHPPSTSTEHSTHAIQPMSSSANHFNHSSTKDHQTTSNASEDDHAHPSANTHSASPAGKKQPPRPSAHRTNDVRVKQHSSTKRSQNPSPSASTHTELIPAVADDCEEVESVDDIKASERALYNDVEYMTSQGAALGLDRTQQYLLDKLRGSHLNEEFEKLLTGHQRDCIVGSMEENRFKNRFNNSILPYDTNRVALLGESNDYINASRIRGYSSSKSYIAAQGPKKNTVIDFWKMVWQEKITHIAMLTNLTEGERIKCAEYWPAYGKHIRYGSVIVTSIDISRRANCVVRTFEIKGSGDGPCHHVSQYHFITWLDHSIPSATALVDFWRTVKTSHDNQTIHSPLLVHCSAGVGRTGTFIALDILMDTVSDGKEISVLHIIQRMREDRINMVQTASQYRFVHEAILEAYTSRHARLALLAFNSFFPNDIDPNKRIEKIDHEYKLLSQMKVLLHKPSRTVASSEENLTKNRTVVFPDDNHLIYLSTFVKGRNQYINAVLMSTFYGRRGSILTQLPLQDTLVDIWRLVHGNDVAVIVSIGAEVDGTEVKCCYWPRKDGESTKFGPFTITLKSKSTPGKHLTSYELSVQLKNSTESRTVSLLQYSGWTDEVPDSTQDLLQLVDLVNSRSVRDPEDEEDKEASPIVVQCLDGATKSGLFRVICDVISRMTYDHDVDVYMAVRHVQIVRPESVTSEVQYRYIYHMIQEYQRRNAVYNN